jgi:ribosomal protein L11 methyltransferase
MVDYIELDCIVNPLQPGTDILIAELNEQGYDSFVETEKGVLAYIPAHLFSQEKVIEIIEPLNAYTIQYSASLIKGRNWNEEWEKSFQPVQVDNRCYIRASFHPHNPEVEFDIVIDPKMAFGTGHHYTTTLMVQQILSTNFKNKATLDMGCGTGILAILAAKLGAINILAIDNDPVAVDSAIENSQRNQTPHIVSQCGDASSLSNQKFDIILANINRNILLNDLSFYCASLNQNGIVILSGYLIQDIEAIGNKAKEVGLSLIDSKESHDWVTQKFEKK